MVSKSVLKFVWLYYNFCALLNDSSIDEDYCDDKQHIRRRLNDSDRVISELLRDGRELIQDIQVANDKREVERRVKEAEIREELLEKLHIETDEALTKFESIFEKWSELKALKDPMGINDELQLQKERIQDLMEQKDKIIDECRKELKAADDRYTRDLLKQTTDIHSLVERVDNQIEIMKRAFKEHLDLLESTIDEERQILRQAATKKWNDLYTRRAVNERIKMRQEKERLEFYEDQIDRIEQEHTEVTRATRIRLEQDNQALEIELQKVKTNTTLNSEKLDYNFQVLKKREDENLMVRNAQKRRLTKLNETIFILRRKIKDAQMNCLIETEKLTSDIIKLRSNISHMDMKVNTFAQANDKKYQSVWQIHKSECLEILKSILEIDKILSEQHLGRKWQAPPMPDECVQKRSETVILAIDDSIPITSQRNTSLVTFDDSTERNQILDILQVVLKQAGFLIDKTAMKLMESYALEEQNLVCLDNIFNALGILNWDDVRKLKEKFEYILKTRYYSNSESLTKSDETNANVTSIIDDKLKVLADANGSEISSTSGPSENLRTLKQFSEHLADVETVPGPSNYTYLSRKLSTKDVKEYWESFKNIFSSNRVKVWDIMEDNLTHYLQVLKERKALDEECEFLKKQNMELQHLLHKMSIPEKFL
ncbi:dynein regulatory complex protein 1 homolog isoform X2 [Topomyia yanbarensis]|uniref:dynein regulatory complex protein 1 homolog isoform X2 n=1 Tax=Topomyia yanbarensis TaxID=2498891 RepID=UPI00273CDF9F|nr:dynein regulatory complex protein 1 homolog isoform X2 [Topomyia yanbarensis]